MTCTLAAYPTASFHPVLSGNKANLTLAPLLYEGLFAVDSQFQAVPLLCEGYTVSEDRLTWTFTLRSGVTFSDGTPLTGETAAQALQTALDPASRYAGRLSGVQSIRGGEGQVVLTLSQPNSSLPLLLDIPIALGTGARPLGTGPYLLTDSGGSLSLTARSDWWQGSGSLPVQEIRLASLTKSDELVSAFNSGEVSLIDVDLTGNSELGSSGSYQVWDYPSTDLLYLGFNASQGLCRDPEVRRAVARAIDRDSLAETIFARHAAAAAIPVHPVSLLYNEELAKRLSYDPSILTDLDLKGRSLTLLVNIENTAKSAAAKTASATSQTPSKRTAAAKKSTASTARKRTTKAKAAAPQTVGEAPAPVIERTSPEQFGRVNVLDITPNVENGLFPARVELGEAFNVTAQVFIEGRTKAGATVSVRNARGREVERFAMTCTNPGLDRWEAMVKIGEHSDLKPWDADYAAVKRQLGEWQIVIEGWEDTYQSWLHDAAIKVKVNDDVENALESGAQLLARWADAKDSKLSAADKKVLRDAAKTMENKSLSAEERLAA